MSHALELLLSIIIVSIERMLDENLSEAQYGFTARKRTRDMIALLKMVIQRTLNANREIIACFIDHEKVFNCVNHEKMMRILKYNVDDRDLNNLKSVLESKCQSKDQKGILEE